MSLHFNYPSTYETGCTYLVAGVVTSEEEYRTDPVIQGACHSEVHGTGRTFDVIMSGVTVSDPTKRYGLHVVTDNNGRQTLQGSSNYNTLSFTCIATSSSGSIAQDTGELPYMVANYNYAENTTASYTTNIPIFDTAEHKEQYIRASTDAIALEILSEYALNYSGGEVVPDGMDFQILQSWTTSEWINDNQPQVNFVNYLGVRGRLVSGRLRLYTIEGINDGCLKDGVLLDNSPEFFGLEVTTDGTTWTPTDTFPYEWIYRKRKNELGTFSYALMSSYIPIPHFPNKDDAENEPDENADNWDEISPYRPPENPTGDPDDETEWGEVYTRAFFSQQYICSATAIQEISNALFDTSPSGIWEDIKKGIEMFGDNPIDCVQSCMFFPFPLGNVFTSVQSQNYIYFGGYKLDLQSNVSKIIYPNGYIDFGSFDLGYTFGSANKPHYRDYAPYQRLYVYLAYCGWYELDIARYIGKTVSVRYYVDTRTGGCLACLSANGVLTDYFNGQMGVAMPITLTDFSAYANSQIQTLLGGGKDISEKGFSAFNGISELASAGTMAGVGAIAGVGALGVGLGASKVVYGLTQNNINGFNKTKGGSTSMLNQYLPQECLFLFEVQDGKETEKHGELLGFPTNESGQLQNFAGYLEVDTVNLKCGIATDNERAEIINYLKSGVFI